jgi:hypothetical protein
MGRVEGKVGFDLCSDLPQVEYPLATPEDLGETVPLVEKTGRRMLGTSRTRSCTW